MGGDFTKRKAVSYQAERTGRGKREGGRRKRESGKLLPSNCEFYIILTMSSIEML